MTKRWAWTIVACLVHAMLWVNCSRGDLTDGLVGYWPLDGLDASDASGNGLDGFLWGDLDVAEDRFGDPEGAMYFPGFTDSYVELDDVEELQITGAMTVAAWAILDPDNMQNGRIIAKRGGGGSRSWSLNIEYEMVGPGESPATFQISSDGSESFIVNDTIGVPPDEWFHMTGVFRPGESVEVYVNGELRVIDDVGIPDEQFSDNGLPVRIGMRNGCCPWHGSLDDVAIWDRDLSMEEIVSLYRNGIGGGTVLQAGDADMDLDFDQLDLVQVQVAAKYLTGQAATWGEGDWDGAPGGSPGDPPAGNGVFDQLDIIAALAAGTYLTGPYGALLPNGEAGDDQASIGYNATTGEVWVDPPAGRDLTSVNIDSASGIFIGDPAQNLGGSFDNDADNNIFKATFGSSFGEISFGNVAQPGLSADFVADDLSVVGSLAAGGDLGDVDLIYVPEPASALLLAVALGMGIFHFRRVRRQW